MYFVPTLLTLFLLYTTAFTLVLPVFNPGAAVAGGFNISLLEDPNKPSIVGFEETGLHFAAQHANSAVSGLHNRI